MTALRINDLRLSKEGHNILSGITFDLEKGGFQLIIGPNGAGKSSLLKCILSIWKDYHGRILLDGAELKQLNGTQRARRLAYVPQSLDLNFNLDVNEFMECARFAFDDHVDERERRIVAAMELTETTHLRYTFMDEISGGERQRILIAAALAQEPQLLVLDEPGNFLDPKHRLDLVRLLKSLHRRQLTILLVTHDWNQYLSLDPQILGLRDGQQVFLGAWSQVQSQIDHLFGCAFRFINIGDHLMSIPDDRGEVS